ncbi:unnamed protein product [Phytophthora fragariaefolia]|uniref:Unnamed protein product n=1 Tax=Phytophthora fragariaefolia TaxID=1490495 RepID=A0A9W7CPZ4_9STRA|nr:unnamed protein product [Phytophthora fragariaefolia]
MVVSAGPFEGKCLKGKEHEVESSFSITKMQKLEITTSFLTALLVLIKSGNVKGRRGKDRRERFNYVSSLVGLVCAAACRSCYDITRATIENDKGRIRWGYFSPIPHGNGHNNNASGIDLSWLRS